MTLLNVYAIKDSKAEAYGLPFFQPTKGLALRSFIELASDPQSSVSRHSADFGLFEIGTYDQLTGRLTPNEMPEFLGLAADLLAAAAPSRAA